MHRHHAAQRLAQEEKETAKLQANLKLNEDRLQAFLDNLGQDEARQKDIQADLAEEAIQLERMLSALLSRNRTESPVPIHMSRMAPRQIPRCRRVKATNARPPSSCHTGTRLNRLRYSSAGGNRLSKPLVWVIAQAAKMAQKIGFSRPESVVPPMKNTKPSVPSGPIERTRCSGRRVWTRKVCM